VKSWAPSALGVMVTTVSPAVAVGLYASVAGAAVVLAPTGAAGNVRVVTAPPGAAVYQLIGFTPDVRVENLDVREPAELLVYLSGYEPQRVTLTEGTYKLEDGRLVADLEIALKAK